MVAKARECQGETVLLTFNPHPRHVVQPHAEPVPMLSTNDEKIRLLSEAGIEHLVEINFTLAFARLSPTDYVRELLVNIVGAKTVVVGYDHRFGANRGGDIRTLRQLSEIFDFSVEEIPAAVWDDVRVSSTKIRQALTDGDVSLANGLLGYEFEIEGTVVKGNGRGRKMGVPTANISLVESMKLVPRNGVYAARCMIGDEWHHAMVNIGTNPTFGNSPERSVEVHVLNFQGDLYGSRLRVKFISRLRDEVKFSSIGALIEQIALDRQQTLRIFS